MLLSFEQDTGLDYKAIMGAVQEMNDKEDIRTVFQVSDSLSDLHKDLRPSCDLSCYRSCQNDLTSDHQSLGYEIRERILRPP